MSRPIGKDACLTCEILRRQHLGTPAGDDSVDLDLREDHQVEYEKMRILAKARHEARDKKPEIGT